MRYRVYQYFGKGDSHKNTFKNKIDALKFMRNARKYKPKNITIKKIKR